MSSVNISGLDKAELLAALYNRAIVLGLGALHADPADMTAEEAATHIAQAKHPRAKSESIYFDYLKGRVMKVDIGGDEMTTAVYNRDMGPGAAEAVVAALRAKSPPPKSSQPVQPRPQDPEAFVRSHHDEILIVPLPYP
jgi:hypothetical protein